MDDNKINPEENQSTSANPGVPASAGDPHKPIFESVPVEELRPEEVAPEVDTSSGPIPPGSDIPPEIPPSIPAAEDSRGKYFIILGGAVFFIVILFFLLRLFLGGSKPQNVRLTYWGLWEDAEVITPVIEDYQRKNPHVTVEYQKMDPVDYRDKLLARSKNGQGPDIFRFHNTWLPEIKDVVAPLPAGVLSNADYEKIFYKVYQKDLKVGDFYYGIPLYLDGLVMLYNDGLLKKAGISSAPQTWDDLTDTVARLTVKDANGSIVTAGIALGLASNIDHYSDILGLMIMQNGASIESLDQPEAAGALESFRKFAEPPNNFWDESMPSSVTAFAQEKVAIIFAPSWQIPVIKSVNPDIQLKVASIPVVPGGTPISLANYWVEGVSKYSKNQTEAWKFVRYLSDKDTMTKLYEAESKVRLFGEPYSRIDLASLLVQNQYVGPVLKQADAYVSAPVISRTYDKGLNDEIVQYLENAINATIEGVSYADALSTAKQGVDQVLQKYKIE